MRRLKKAIFLAFPALLGLLSCQREGPTTWDTELSAPLARKTLTTADIVPDSNLEEQPDTSLHLVWDRTFYELPVDSLLKIPDTTLTDFYSIPAQIDVGPGQTLVDDESNTRYDLGEASLSTVELRKGKLVTEIRNTVAEETRYEYRIRNAFRNGSMFSVSRVAPPGSVSDPGVVRDTFDLSGYRVKLNGVNGQKENTLETRVIVSIVEDGKTVTITPNDTVRYTNHFIGLVPEFARGYFGRRSLNIQPGKAKLDIFNAVQSGQLDIDQVDVELTLDNGIGVDAKGRLPFLRSIRNEPPSSVSLSHSVVNDPITINRAKKNGENIEHSIRRYQFNNANSNIDAFLENLPDRIGYDLNMEMNPVGDVSNGNDFIQYGHSLSAKLHIDLPLCLIANNLTLSDTLSVSPEKEDPDKGIREGTLHLRALNGYPLGASLTLVLLNEDGSRGTTILDGGQIEQAPLNAQQEPTGKSISNLDIRVDKDQVRAIFDSDRWLVLATFDNTPTTEHVKIRGTQNLQFRITGDIGYRISYEGS